MSKEEQFRTLELMVVVRQTMKEQQDTIDLLLSMLRETLDELDGYCVKFERFSDIIEKTDELAMMERFK